ncbi:MAG: hypothetical protein RIQ81_568 [Pseudomonadota bacterium]|jgi:hypothetical protein
MSLSPYPKPIKISALRLGVVLSAILASCGQADFKGGAPAKPVPQREQVRETTPPIPPQGPVGDQITETEVHFGDDKIFHIGDNNYPGSSCKGEIDTYKINGNRYFFEFEVTEPDTIVDIAVNKICGVDYARSNVAMLAANGRTFQAQPLAVQGGNLQLSGVRLQRPGKYALVIESRRDFAHIRQGDNDDFLVGQIAIKASKRIVGGVVRTE